MKKILLILLLSIFLIPGVNAEVDEACTLVGSYSSNDYKFKFNTKFHHYYLYTNDEVAVTFPANKDLYYTVYFDNADTINLNNYLLNFSGSDQLQITKNDYYYIFKLGDYPAYNANIFTDVELLEEWNTFNVYSSETEIACIPLVEEEPEPDPVIPADTSLDTFYSIYLDKLVLLSNFAIENKYVLSAIVIILVFTFTGLFIHLFKGGWK